MPVQVNILTNMGEMAVRRVEQAWATAQRAAAPHLRFARALFAYLTPILFVDTGVYPWAVLYCNAAAGSVTGAVLQKQIQDASRGGGVAPRKLYHSLVGGVYF